jgi:hypothetical protein
MKFDLMLDGEIGNEIRIIKTSETTQKIKKY